MKKKTYLITGAGSGFGWEIALQMAKKNENVIAGVKNRKQAKELAEEAEKRNVRLKIEKLDITSPEDRELAGSWDVDVLLNNAAVSLGGSMADIPEEILRKQYEVNFFGTIFLTQKVVHQMIPKREGKIVFVSSVHGLMADPISGPYCSSKFAIEAAAESLSKELQEYGIEVALINPGPYMTGLNDREYASFYKWKDDPEKRLFDYENMSFPYEQFINIDPVVKGTIDVMTGKSSAYRTVIPKAMGIYAKKRQRDLWGKKTNKGLGKRHPLIKREFKMEPETTVAEGIYRMITQPFEKEENKGTLQDKEKK